jgi:hypothetical protein
MAGPAGFMTPRTNTYSPTTAPLTQPEKGRALIDRYGADL